MSLLVSQELAPKQRKESLLMLPLRKKGEFSNYSLCLTTASQSTDLRFAVIFLGESTALFSCQVKKVRGWLGERCQGMLGSSPGKKRS